MIKFVLVKFVNVFNEESAINCVNTALLIIMVSPDFFKDVSAIDIGNCIALKAFKKSSAFTFSLPERSGEEFLQLFKINIAKRQKKICLMQHSFAKNNF